MEFKLKALTPIWTGGVKKGDDKLHLTGIKGSIRWWYEVLIRGLGSYACDPTARTNKHCELKPIELDRDKPLDLQVKEKICPACYMFGCTGWSGKFILQLKEPNTNKPVRSLSSRDVAFTLHFIEQKKFDPEEEILLKMTLNLIIDYGAIGGRTVLKPSECDYKNIKKYKNKKIHASGHHLDYGIIDRCEDEQENNKGNDASNIPTILIYTDNKKNIEGYLDKFNKTSETNNIEWPSLKNFWFVKNNYIKRDEHNKIVSRDISKGVYKNPDSFKIFLGGYIERDKKKRMNDLPFPDYDSSSKKIFSFHGIKTDAKIKDDQILKSDDECISLRVRRCFGYAKKNELENVIKLIEEHVGRLKGEIKRGTEVLDEL